MVYIQQCPAAAHISEPYFGESILKTTWLVSAGQTLWMKVWFQASHRSAPWLILDLRWVFELVVDVQFERCDDSWWIAGTINDMAVGKSNGFLACQKFWSAILQIDQRRKDPSAGLFYYWRINTINWPSADSCLSSVFSSFACQW